MSDRMINRILIIEDDKEHQAVIERLVAKMGYHTELASDYEEAKNILEHQLVDLVISDINLGGDKDGLDLMEKVKQGTGQPDFIIMTGVTGNYSYADIVSAGAADFIPKTI
ncbi:MAG: response regulator, partial [Deltaproteobacteria bacterium]|nr:response regulator [Deltaproteobacteria bacterium]